VRAYPEGKLGGEERRDLSQDRPEDRQVQRLRSSEGLSCEQCVTYCERGGRVYVRERERACVRVRERECVRVCLSEREYVRVILCEREREREKEREPHSCQ